MEEQDITTVIEEIKDTPPEELTREIRDPLNAIYKKLLEIDPPVKKLAVFGGNYIKLLDIQDICFITVDDDRRRIVTSDGKEWYLKETMTVLQKRFKDDPKMMLVHRAYIANLLQVDKIFIGEVSTRKNRKSSTMHLMFKTLPEEIKVPVSENNQTEVKEYLGIKLPNTTAEEPPLEGGEQPPQ
ncbi:MAG: LytTR family transcriptional regulator DNA-binding domain-containing protein [Candidatus Eremiobacterota bacterium]